MAGSQPAIRLRARGFMQSASQVFSRKGFSVIAIVFGAVTFFAVIHVIHWMPSDLFGSHKRGSETDAIQTLRAVHNAQARFFDTHKRFGSLQELFDARLLEINLSSQSPVAGYAFSESGISESGYCVHATRESRSGAYRDFNVTEEAVIRANTARTPAVLVRGEGVLISDSQIGEN
jgi:hypothetical protein